METLHPSRIRPWGDLDWPRTLQVGKGLNNLNKTCFCNAVLQCLTHTAPLANFCLDRRHSRRLDSAAATVAYYALLAVERHVIEAFGSSQSSLSPIDIVTNLIKMGPHFAAGVQQDAHEFLRSLTANIHARRCYQHQMCWSVRACPVRQHKLSLPGSIQPACTR